MESARSLGYGQWWGYLEYERQTVDVKAETDVTSDMVCSAPGLATDALADLGIIFIRNEVRLKGLPMLP